MRAALVGLLVNLALGVAKLVAGLVTGSVALVSDAVHSLGDVFSSVVVIVALLVAQKPADREHPYGHTRADAIAASNAAVLLVLSAVAVAWEAVREFGVPHEPAPAWAMWLAAANVVIMEGLFHYKQWVGRRTGSAAVIVHAWDHRNDALSALAVLVGLGAAHFGGPSWSWGDEVAALVVSVTIVWSGVRLFRQSASELMDLQADEPILQKVRAAALVVPGVLAVEKLWVRKSGMEYFADIHIEVDATMTVAEGHRIGHLVKDHLLEALPNLRDVLVHLEPHGQRWSELGANGPEVGKERPQ